MTSHVTPKFAHPMSGSSSSTERKSLGNEVSEKTPKSIQEWGEPSASEDVDEPTDNSLPSSTTRTQSSISFGKDERFVPSSELKAVEPRARAESSSSGSSNYAPLAGHPGKAAQALDVARSKGSEKLPRDGTFSSSTTGTQSSNSSDKDERPIPPSELKADEPRARAESPSSESSNDAPLAGYLGRAAQALDDARARAAPALDAARTVLKCIKEKVIEGPVNTSGIAQSIASTLTFGMMIAVQSEVAFGLEAVGFSPGAAFALGGLAGGIYNANAHTPVNAMATMVTNRYLAMRKWTVKKTLTELGKQKAQFIRSVASWTAFTILGGVRAAAAEGHFNNDFMGVQEQLGTKMLTIAVAGYVAGAGAELLRMKFSHLFDKKMVPANDPSIYKDYLNASKFPVDDHRKRAAEWTGKYVGQALGTGGAVWFQSPDFISRTSAVGHGFVDGAMPSAILLGGWFLGTHFCAWMHSSPDPEGTIADIENVADFINLQRSADPHNFDVGFARHLRQFVLASDKPMSPSEFKKTLVEFLDQAREGKREDPKPEDLKAFADKLVELGAPQKEADYMASKMLTERRPPVEDTGTSVESESQLDDVVIEMPARPAPSRAAQTAAPALTPAQALDLIRTPMTDLLAASGLQSMPSQKEKDELAALCVAYQQLSGKANRHNQADVNGVISSFGGGFPTIFAMTNSAALGNRGEALFKTFDFGLIEPDFTEFARDYLAAAVSYKISKEG